MARKGWDNLSAPYRKRLASAGISEASYNAGTSLKWARGRHAAEVETYYHRRRRSGDPPIEDLERLKLGMANTPQRRRVERWYAQEAPEYLRDSGLAADTAAELYLTDLKPELWESVEMFTQRDGSVTVYLRSRRHGKIRKFELADRESAEELVDYISRHLDQAKYGPPDVEWHDSPKGRKQAM